MERGPATVKDTDFEQPVRLHLFEQRLEAAQERAVLQKDETVLRARHVELRGRQPEVDAVEREAIVTVPLKLFPARPSHIMHP